MNSPFEHRLSRARQALESLPAGVVSGVLSSVKGPVLRAVLPGATIGDRVTIARVRGGLLEALVSAFDENGVILTPLGSTVGLTPNAEVRSLPVGRSIEIPANPFGGAIDARGKRLLGETPASERILLPLENTPPVATSRPPINQRFTTGIHVIDAFTPVGVGQRLVVIAEPGVGKSTLLSMIAHSTSSTINVIALIGERGREVSELLELLLTRDISGRTIVIVSTSDEPAAMRVQAALLATSIAEYYRDRGEHVLLQIDSLTRLCRAYRELGLAAGELPVRRGYPPSVFAALPNLLERAGPAPIGSITAFYTLLSNGELDEDPMVEEIKSLADGHIVLKRELAERGVFPAVDILSSLSRLTSRLLTERELKNTQELRRLEQRARDDRDLAQLSTNIDPELAHALATQRELQRVLTQGMSSPVCSDINEQLSRLAATPQHYAAI